MEKRQVDESPNGGLRFSGGRGDEMNAAIRVENLSKRYQLGSRTVVRYQTVRESISNSVAGVWRGLRHRLEGKRAAAVIGKSHDASFWALKDVSFEVQPGETVGIIGHNGAGKSTLLKILSRISDPTAGRCEIRGRLGSLLEVGTGFHPELTGRENIYMNGSILNMKRKEIDRKFDDIVAFAEIEQFLDTPVKRYSSGMYVRLAFAVSAHLEPEIVVVDEVLAVGDVAFQKKCLDKMRDAGREGRTTLFVSHNMDALRRLCQRGIVLEHGRLVKDTSIEEAVSHYLRSLEANASIDLSQRTDRQGLGKVRLHKVDINGEGACEPGVLTMGRPARFVFHMEPPTANTTCIFAIYDCSGMGVCRFNSALGNLTEALGSGTEDGLACTIDEVLLAPGRYRINTALFAGGELQDKIEAAACFDVVRGTVRGREPPKMEHGWVVFVPHEWHNRHGTECAKK